MNFWRHLKNHSPWVDIAVFAVILSMFLYGAHHITRNPHASDSVQNNIPHSEDLREVERVPASSPVSAQDNSVQIIELGCLPLQQKKFQVKSSYLRFSATGCGKKKISISSASGMNQTNGYDFTCFLDDKSQRLATNYFLLNPGENKVQLSVLWANGRKEDELIEVERTQ